MYVCDAMGIPSFVKRILRVRSFANLLPMLRRIGSTKQLELLRVVHRNELHIRQELTPQQRKAHTHTGFRISRTGSSRITIKTTFYQGPGPYSSSEPQHDHTLTGFRGQAWRQDLPTRFKRPTTHSDSEEVRRNARSPTLAHSAVFPSFPNLRPLFKALEKKAVTLDISRYFVAQLIEDLMSLHSSREDSPKRACAIKHSRTLTLQASGRSTPRQSRVPRISLESTDSAQKGEPDSFGA